jgi:parallel beta-helix repeat protein
MLLLLLPLAHAVETHLQSIEALRTAVASAQPGDVLILDPGTYRLESTLSITTGGSPEAPITLRGDGATLESTTVEAIKVSAPDWHFEGLSMVGRCTTDSDCEHALHIVGEADRTEVRNGTFVDFNAQIKGNGEEVGGSYVWPDDVHIEGNNFYDTRPRLTSNPVTKIDVVGGQRWHIVANRIADFEKGEGDTVSYAAFLKGNSKDGILERNLVLCSHNFSGGVRIGLSLGGGGTSPDSICEEGSCSPENRSSILRNNIIVGCSDVGIYLNEAEDARILGNTLYQTSGIDVRYPASTVFLANNLLDRRIRERDGGTATTGINWAELDLSSVFVDPAALDFSLATDPGIVDAGEPHPELTDDFCGRLRDALPDGGALEYSSQETCDTTQTHPDQEEAGDDTGGSEDSAGDDDSAADQDSKGPPDSSACGCSGTGTSGVLLLGIAGWIAGRSRPRKNE